jgi:hypothetical protein
MPRRGANSDPVRSFPLARINTVAKTIPRAKSLPLEKVRSNKKVFCYRILTPKQVGPICWFMAAFVAMFYSQRSRKILLEASKDWDKEDKSKPLFTLLKHVLNDKYLKTASRESDDYRNFSDDTFINILKYLNKHDPLSFPYDPTIHRGFNSEFYMGKLYKLLKVDYKVFEYNKKDDHLFYSHLNNGFDNAEYETIGKRIEINLLENKLFTYIDELMDAPKIIIVIVALDEDTEFYEILKILYPNTIIGDGDTKKNITSMNDKIFYRGSEYHLDSVILSNWNIQNGGHAIAGITCKKDKYIYNGWSRRNMNPTNIPVRIPCELMRYNWDIKQDGEFCLDTKRCIADTLGIKSERKRLCFNFIKGGRILVYVRKDAISATSSATSSNTMSNEIIERQKQEEELLKLLTKLYTNNSINTKYIEKERKNYTKKLSKLNTDSNIMSNKIIERQKFFNISELYNK